MPRGSADKLPSTLCGALVAIADKMDTVAGIIGLDASHWKWRSFCSSTCTNGIVQIISHRKWDFNIFALADEHWNNQ
jgi:glycyl-tRNA synthetase beta chain